MSISSATQEPSAAQLVPAEDCEPVFRWTKDSRIVRACKQEVAP